MYFFFGGGRGVHYFQMSWAVINYRYGKKLAFNQDFRKYKETIF